MFPECAHNVALQYGLLVSLFLGGLEGSVSHCVGMCGPFVVAQSSHGLSLQKLGRALLLPYHFGRMTTYVALSAVFYSVLNLAFLFSNLKSFIAAPLLLLAGTIFLASAFPRVAVLFPWAGRIGFGKIYFLLKDCASRLMSNPGTLSRYLLGVLLGFMPCGLVVAALMASSTAPDLLQAVTAMAAFTVGTMPALILVSLGSSTFKQRYPKAARYFSQSAMVISSLWLFTLAGIMIF